jgi:hypothetical protein
MLQFLTAFVSLFSLFLKTGGGVDPDGLLSGSEPPHVETGGGVDPNGRT